MSGLAGGRCCVEVSTDRRCRARPKWADGGRPVQIVWRVSDGAQRAREPQSSRKRAAWDRGVLRSRTEETRPPGQRAHRRGHPAGMMKRAAVNQPPGVLRRVGVGSPSDSLLKPLAARVGLHLEGQPIAPSDERFHARPLVQSSVPRRPRVAHALPRPRATRAPAGAEGAVA